MKLKPKALLFDMDGTLTEPRGPFDKKLLEPLRELALYAELGIVTGSDKDKTIEQVGEKIWNNCTRVYQSCGNAVYENGKLIRQNMFSLQSEVELHGVLIQAIVNSKVQRWGNHIEERIGLINYSTIGRNCPQEARERELFCKIVEDTFPELEATVGGEISIDIYPKGKNKAQVLQDIIGPITFFGDKCQPGGNDYPIVERLGQLNEENNLSCVIHSFFSHFLIFSFSSASRLCLTALIAVSKSSTSNFL